MEKLMKKPRPPPSPKNATVINETSAEGNSTTPNEPIVVNVDQVPGESREGEGESKGSDKEDL